MSGRHDCVYRCGGVRRARLRYICLRGPRPSAACAGSFHSNHSPIKLLKNAYCIRNWNAIRNPKRSCETTPISAPYFTLRDLFPSSALYDSHWNSPLLSWPLNMYKTSITFKSKVGKVVGDLWVTYTYLHLISISMLFWWFRGESTHETEQLNFLIFQNHDCYEEYKTVYLITFL